MVQKSARTSSEPPRRRGRPRAFEPETALNQAMEAFWQDGFAATSLDDLAAATGLNRPSLYGAFGDKRALYLEAYRRYRRRVNEDFVPLFQARAPLRTKLRRIFMAALNLYMTGEQGPRGCFTVLSAASDAVADPELRRLVGEAIDATDRAFGRLFAEARAAGELPANSDPRALAHVAAATIHTLSIRARARIRKTDILPIIDAAVKAICGSGQQAS